MSTITPAAVTPVTGAAATTPSYSGTFIPSLWSGKLIAKFYATTMFGEICNTDYQGEISNLGDKIIINSIPDVAIADYLVGGTLSYGVPTPVANVELQINKAKAFTFNLPDVLEYQARPKLLDVFSGEASAKMKIYIDDDLLFNSYSTGAAANKGATAGVRSAAYNLGIDTAPVALTASNVLTVLTQLAGVLDEQNVPDADRYLIIDPLTRNILMQSNLAQAQFTGDAASLVRTGKTGWWGKAVATQVVRVRMGFVSSALAYSTPFGHLLPETLTSPSCKTAWSGQPLGQTMQTISFSIIPPPRAGFPVCHFLLRRRDPVPPAPSPAALNENRFC